MGWEYWDVHTAYMMRNAHHLLIMSSIKFLLQSLACSGPGRYDGAYGGW